MVGCTLWNIISRSMVVSLLKLREYKTPNPSRHQNPIRAVRAYTKSLLRRNLGSPSLFLLLGGVPLVIHGREALKDQKRQGRKRIDEWWRVKKTGGLGCGDCSESEEAGHFWRENLSIYIADQTKNISGRLDECCRGKKGRWRMVGVQITGFQGCLYDIIHTHTHRL